VFHPRLRAFNFAMRAVAQGLPMAIAVLRVTSPFVGRPGPCGGHRAPCVSILSSRVSWPPAGILIASGGPAEHDRTWLPALALCILRSVGAAPLRIPWDLRRDEYTGPDVRTDGWDIHRRRFGVVIGATLQSPGLRSAAKAPSRVDGKHVRETESSSKSRQHILTLAVHSAEADGGD
jgi:hypothetical protein